LATTIVDSSSADSFVRVYESDSERIPRSLLRELASEYEIEQFLAIRYLAGLLRGSSFIRAGFASGAVKLCTFHEIGAAKSGHFRQITFSAYFPMAANGILEQWFPALDAPEITTRRTEADRKILYPFHMLTVFGLTVSTAGTYTDEF
jgi:hypothetical protein